MKKSDIKNLTKDELIDLLFGLSKLNKENNAFLKSKLSLGHNDLFKLSCKKIDKAFSYFEVMSLKDARKALVDFKKSNPNDSLFIELCIYYIKQAYHLEKTDWRFQESFYSAIEKVYDIIFDMIKKDDLLKDRYKVEVEKLIKKSNEGWSHRDYLEEKFEEIIEIS